jgi:hypothetical protein
MLFLFNIYQALTPNSTTITFVASIVVKLNVFGSLASTKEVAMGFIRNESLFFKRIAVPIDPFNPFTRWAKHEQWFPNLTYVSRQVMGIVGSQIEIERIFSTVKVTTSLKCCWLGIENLDKLVIIMKNWLHDPRFRCTNGPKSFEICFNSKNNVIVKNEDLFAGFNLFEKD